MNTSKYPFCAFEKHMRQDSSCIEIGFCIDGDTEYNYCWLGKTLFEGKDKSLYWFGLVKDGSQGYDYETFEEFASDKVFRGKCLEELWDFVSVYSVFGPGMSIGN